MTLRKKGQASRKKHTKNRRNRTQRRRRQRCGRRQRQIRGGFVGNTEATFYLLAFPNHMNAEETIPYYEVKQTNLKDIFNLDATENLFRGMVTNTPMRAYTKTFSMEQN